MWVRVSKRGLPGGRSAAIFRATGGGVVPASVTSGRRPDHAAMTQPQRENLRGAGGHRQERAARGTCATDGPRKSHRHGRGFSRARAQVAPSSAPM